MTGGDDTKALQNQIKEIRPQRIVAVGGDGTLKFVAEQVAGKDMLLGFLPAGSANGMAAELGLPRGMEACLEIVAGDDTMRVDAIMINGHFSIHLGDIGLNAELIKYFEQSERRGLLGYAKEVARVLRGRGQMRIRVRTPDRQVKGKASIVLLANGRMYGTGVTVNLNGSMSDGKFEVIIIREVTIWGLLKGFILRRVNDSIRYKTICTEKVEIEINRNAHFQVDGEYIGEERKIKAHIRKGVLKMLIAKPK